MTFFQYNFAGNAILTIKVYSVKQYGYYYVKKGICACKTFTVSFH